MAIGLIAKKIGKFFGSGDMHVATLSVTTAASAIPPTVLERQGVVSVTRTGAGAYTVLLGQGYKFITVVGQETNAASTTSMTIVTKTPGGATPGFTFTCTTTNSGTAVDVLATYDFIIVGRRGGN